MTQNEIYQQWLQGLKQGDQFAYCNSGRAYCIGTVERVTQTQIVGSHDRRWRRKDGRYIGGSSFNRTGNLVPVTKDIREEVELRRGMDWLSELARSKVTLNQLRAMRRGYEAATALETSHAA